MGRSISSAATVSVPSHPWFRKFASREFLAICTTVLLSALLCFLVFTGDPVRRFNLFQNIAVVFFVLTLLRQFPRPKQVGEVELVSVGPESKGLAGLLAALALGSVAYAATVPLFFIDDDFVHLDLVRHPFMTAIWPQVTKGQFDGITYIFYRPLGFFSLFLDYRLWHNWAPGYHLTNILLHLLCIAAVFFFCKELGLRNEICVAAPLAFAVLPVNVQAITWIACRFDQLATTLGMWSLVFAARFRRTGQIRSYGMAIFLFVLAVISKESAYVVPVLWLALELIPRDQHALRPTVAKKFGPLLGYIVVPLVMLLHRFYTLGEIGGYHNADGTPVATLFGMPSLLGVLVRAPGETLFGYNWWIHSDDRTCVFAAGATAAIFLTLCLFAKTSLISRRVTWFCLIWVFAAALPSHFYFRDPDRLFFSRALQFGSIGIAILIALLLGQLFSNPKILLGWAFAISLLSFIAVQHNISAWRLASSASRSVLAAIDQIQPSPHPNATFYIKGIPDGIAVVPLFHVGLESAVRFSYSWRNDIHVDTPNSSSIDPDAIVMDFTPRVAPSSSLNLRVTK
jgi:catechol 2,3-dioxygenase-like lactoylglutathione lyase family enzyme